MRGSHADERGGESGLREHVLERRVAADLDDEAVVHLAGRLGGVGGTVAQRLDLAFDVRDLGARLGDQLVEAVLLERLQHRGVIGHAADRRGECGALLAGRKRQHELGVLQRLCAVAVQHVDGQLGRDAPGDLAEFREGREELVMAGRHRGRRQEEAHRHGVDHGVELPLIAHGLGNRRLVGRAGGHHHEPVLEPHAKALARRPADQRFGIDRA